VHYSRQLHSTENYFIHYVVRKSSVTRNIAAKSKSLSWKFRDSMPVLHVERVRSDLIDEVVLDSSPGSKAPPRSYGAIRGPDVIYSIKSHTRYHCNQGLWPRWQKLFGARSCWELCLGRALLLTCPHWSTSTGFVIQAASWRQSRLSGSVERGIYPLLIFHYVSSSFVVLPQEN
jgi:hypothetical protein